jgi:hypothetical protein
MVRPYEEHRISEPVKAFLFIFVLPLVIVGAVFAFAVTH